MTSDIPSGTVTFLVTDIEASATIAREHPADWEALQARHHAIPQSAIEACRGDVFPIAGDAFYSAFHMVSDGVHAAVQAQRQLQAEGWGAAPTRVRMGIHTGEAQAHGGDYLGYLTLTCVQRVMAPAHGGQILLSDSSTILVSEALSRDLTLKDLGERRLKGLPNTGHLWQVCTPDLRQDFPPFEWLRTVPNNLPVELISFVGRETDRADVASCPASRFDRNTNSWVRLSFTARLKSSQDKSSNLAHSPNSTACCVRLAAGLTRRHVQRKCPRSL
jgi:class 3 adenylate cyclase